MKTLVLRPEGPEYTVTTREGQTLTLTEPKWRDMVQQTIDSPPLNPQGEPMGFDHELMRKRLRLSDAVAKVPEDGTELKLEDADANELAAALSSLRWIRTSKWTLDFADAIKALPNGKA